MLGNTRPGIIIRFLLASLNEFLPQGFVFKQLPYGPGQFFTSARSRQKPIDAIVDHRTISTDIRCHHRSSRRHRFQQHDTHTFSSGSRRAEDMRTGEVTPFILIRDIAGEDDLLPPVLLDKLLKASSQATISYKKESRVRVPFANVGDSP